MADDLRPTSLSIIDEVELQSVEHTMQKIGLALEQKGLKLVMR